MAGESGRANEKEDGVAPEEVDVEEGEVDGLSTSLTDERRCSGDYLTRLKYLQADFDNYRRRNERYLEEYKKNCIERLVNSLLEVIDELELALKSGKTTGGCEALMQGVEMTLKKFRKVLEGEGVTAIESVGKPFDTSMHEAVEVSLNDQVQEGTILDEIRKGYVMNGRVIRPSLVRISKKSNGEDEKKEGSEVAKEGEKQGKD